MKKFLLLMTGMAIASAASAESELKLVLETTDGNQQAFEATGLTMAIDGDNLLVNPAEESNGQFALIDLNKMFFTTEWASIELPAIDLGTTPVEVYSLEGRSLGRYNSASEAAASLAAGVYVMKSGTTTYKIAVK